jgi:hypothetical protein
MEDRVYSGIKILWRLCITVCVIYFGISFVLGFSGKMDSTAKFILLTSVMMTSYLEGMTYWPRVARDLEKEKEAEQREQQ